MNPIRTIRQLAAARAGLTGALLAFAAAAPAAFAMPPPAHRCHRRPPLPPAHVHQFVHIPIPVRTVLIGGTPGWQITLSPEKPGPGSPPDRNPRPTEQHRRRPS